MKPKLQKRDRDNEKSILPEERSRLICLFLLSPMSIFVKCNCPATTATLTVNGFQPVKYKNKGDFREKKGAFSRYFDLVAVGRSLASDHPPREELQHLFFIFWGSK